MKTISSRGAPWDVGFSFHLALRTQKSHSSRTATPQTPQFDILGVVVTSSPPADDQAILEVQQSPVSGVPGSQLPVPAQKKHTKKSSALEQLKDDLEWETQS